MTATAETVTRRRTYETAISNSGPAAFLLDCVPGHLPGGDCDPTGQTGDGSIDVGGASIAPDAATRNATAVRVRVVDDVRGAGVVGAGVCWDLDGDRVCHPEEASARFCGQGPWLTPVEDPRGWVRVEVFVYSGLRHALYCPDAPTQGGTSGGVLDPAAGIYVDFRLPGSP